MEKDKTNEEKVKEYDLLKSLFSRRAFLISAGHKPDSVLGYHLSVPKVTLGNQAAYPSWPQREKAGRLPTMGCHDLCGISARKVYPQQKSLFAVVSSYLTFSPLSTRGRRLFSVALSVPDCSRPGCSPVRCPLLSGLSSLVSQRDSLLRKTKLLILTPVSSGKFQWHHTQIEDAVCLQRN